jgi:hypothetical protein
MPNHMKIRQVRAEFFMLTDITTPIVAFRNFANAHLKKKKKYRVPHPSKFSFHTSPLGLFSLLVSEMYVLVPLCLVSLAF